MPAVRGDESRAPGSGARLKSPKGGAAGIRGGRCVEIKAGEKCRAACASLPGAPGPGVSELARPPRRAARARPAGRMRALLPRQPGPCPRPRPRNYSPRAGSRPGLRPMLLPPSLGAPGWTGSVPAENPLCRGWVLPGRCVVSAGAGLPGRRCQAIQYPQWSRTPHSKLRGYSEKELGPLPAPSDAWTSALEPRPAWGAGEPRAPRARRWRLGAPSARPRPQSRGSREV